MQVFTLHPGECVTVTPVLGAPRSPIILRWAKPREPRPAGPRIMDPARPGVHPRRPAARDVATTSFSVQADVAHYLTPDRNAPTPAPAAKYPAEVFTLYPQYAVTLEPVGPVGGPVIIRAGHNYRPATGGAVVTVEAIPGTLRAVAAFPNSIPKANPRAGAFRQQVEHAATAKAHPAGPKDTRPDADPSTPPGVGPKPPKTK